MADTEDETSLLPEKVEKNVAVDPTETVKESTPEISDDVDSSPPSAPEVVERSIPSVTSSQPRSRRLFGREKPVHQVLGGGKSTPLPLFWQIVYISKKKNCKGPKANWILCCRVYFI
jgi:hypothetical protein